MSMGNSGAINVFPVSYMGESGAQNVFPVSYMGESGAQNVYRVSYYGDSGAKNVYHVKYYGDSGAKNVYYVGCFPESELVHTGSDVYVPIGSLKVGDKICSWEAERKKMQYTVVSEIHKYIVNEIISLNNIIRVSSSHPLFVMELDKNGIFIPKWKVAFNINIGDHLIGIGGKLTEVKTKVRYWYNFGTEVLSLSTFNGAPFFAGNCVVGAENTQGGIEYKDTHLIQKQTA